MAEDSIPRNPIQAIGPCGFMVLLFLLWYNWKDPGKEAANNNTKTDIFVAIGTISSNLRLMIMTSTAAPIDRSSEFL